MEEKLLEKITNIRFIEKEKTVENAIAFQIEGMEFCMNTRNRKGLVKPGLLIHYEGTCPFCKKNTEMLEICTGFKGAEERREVLFHHLTNHPTIRLKFLLRRDQLL